MRSRIAPDFQTSSLPRASGIIRTARSLEINQPRPISGREHQSAAGSRVVWRAAFTTASAGVPSRPQGARLGHSQSNAQRRPQPVSGYPIAAGVPDARCDPAQYRRDRSIECLLSLSRRSRNAFDQPGFSADWNWTPLPILRRPLWLMHHLPRCTINVGVGSKTAAEIRDRHGGTCFDS